MNLYQFVSVTKFFIALAVVALLGVGGYFVYTKVAGGFIKAGEVATDTGNFISGKPTENGTELGGACNVGADCKGFISALDPKVGAACCGGACRTTQKDFANVSYCPNECKGWLGAPNGTCGPKRLEGQACVAHEQCANWHGPGQAGSGCDGGRCVAMKKDWAGVLYYIPSECVGRAFGPKGSC
jgi:hypothetical protein